MQRVEREEAMEEEEEVVVVVLAGALVGFELRRELLC